MPNKVTLQHIADALHISRNSVSKAINGHDGISPKMRQVVLETAATLGYKKIHIAQSATNPVNATRIHVITKADFNSHFWGEVIRGIEAVASMTSLNVIVSMAKPDASGELSLPEIEWDKSLGIILIEMYNRKYIEMILQHTNHVVSLDISPDLFLSPLQMDVLMTRSAQSYRLIIKHILAQGREKIAFIGGINDCQGFHERWETLNQVLNEARLPLDMRLCLTCNQSNNLDYRNLEWLREQIAAFPYWPDAILCGNDVIAMTAMKAIKSLGKRCPEDVMIAGFDGLPECDFVEPSITTAEAPREELGNRAVEILLERSKKPRRSYSVLYLDSSVRFRASTGPILS